MKTRNSSYERRRSNLKKTKKKIKKVSPELRSAPVSPPRAQYNAGPVSRVPPLFCYSLTHFSIIDRETWHKHVCRNLLSAASSAFKAQHRAGNRGSPSREAPPGASTTGEEIEMSAGITMAHADRPLSVLFLPVFADTAWSALPQVSDFYALPLPRGEPRVERGLRLPSLKSDVHSTCWFFKQLCPQKFRKSGQAARPSVFGRHWGGARGWGWARGVWSPS